MTNIDSYAAGTVDTGSSPVLIPWTCIIRPPWYEPEDVFTAEVWTRDADGALAAAIQAAMAANDDPSDEDDADPDLYAVITVEIDFRRFAGPLMAWAEFMGGWEGDLWTTFGAAVKAAGIVPATLTIPSSED